MYKMVGKVKVACESESGRFVPVVHRVFLSCDEFSMVQTK
jgi:hypothetical protein